MENLLKVNLPINSRVKEDQVFFLMLCKDERDSGRRAFVLWCKSKLWQTERGGIVGDVTVMDLKQ